MAIITFFAAFVIGLVLGLTGGGGSILTVPVLVYMIGLEPMIAIGYSLFIVGATALAGAINYAFKQLINIKAALVFAVPSFVSVFCVRRWIIPHIPNELFYINGHLISKNTALMIIFAILMIIISISMISNKKRKGVEVDNVVVNFHYRLIGSQGLAVGMVTGLLGAGGGFIIVPALVLLANLPIRLAIGTSLLIIAINSLIGFMGDIYLTDQIDWNFLLTFSGFAILGVFSGSYLSKYISAKNLKIGFGAFLFVVGAYIILKEVFLNNFLFS